MHGRNAQQEGGEQWRAVRVMMRVTSVVEDAVLLLPSNSAPTTDGWAGEGIDHDTAKASQRGGGLFEYSSPAKRVCAWGGGWGGGFCQSVIKALLV